MARDASRRPLKLNGFHVRFDRSEFEVFVQPGQADVDLPAQRAGHPYWHHYREKDHLVVVRASPDAPTPSGEREDREVDRSFGLLRWIIDDQVPDAFPSNKAVGAHPFTFIGTARNFVLEALDEVRTDRDLLSGFAIQPKYSVQTRVIAPRGRPAFIGLFVSVGTRWMIERSLDDLVEAGIDLRGMYVVQRDVDTIGRRLLGRIDRVSGGVVELSDTVDESTQVTSADVWLEGSRHSFVRCARHLMGPMYERFDTALDRRTSAWFSPDMVDKEIDRLAGHMARQPLQLTDGLAMTIGNRIEIARKGGKAPNVVTLPRVRYCFDAARTKEADAAWTGLAKFGPFSRDGFATKSPRVAVVFPDILQGRAETFIRALRDGVTGANGSAYPSGFARTFGLVSPEFVKLVVPWSGQGRPVDRYRNAIETRLAQDTNLDAAIIVLRDEDARLSDAENPYLHSKALLLVNGIPSQEILQSTLADDRGLPFTLRNMTIALYAKLGGTPWTVNQHLTISDEIVVGLGLCELADTRFKERQRFVGVTTVFRGDGNYLLGNLSRECSFDEYPEVLRQSTTQVLEDIKRRNGWQPGDTVRVVFHARRPLRHVETAKIMADCVEAVGGDQSVEFAFLTVSDDHPFKVIDPYQNGVRSGKGRLVPERGTVITATADSRLLAVTGPSLVLRNPAPLPSPLLIRLQRASTFKDLDYLTEQVLKFTALSWRSTRPSAAPATIRYSELIAELLGRLRAVRDWSPAVLNTKLRASRWFL